MKKNNYRKKLSQEIGDYVYYPGELTEKEVRRINMGKKFDVIIGGYDNVSLVDGEVFNKLNIKNFFQIIVSGDDVEQSKPNPEIFLKAAKLLNVAPNECVVIEDSTNEVKAAKDAGMKCIGFLNPHSGKQNLENADMVITEFLNKSSYIHI